MDHESRLETDAGRDMDRLLEDFFKSELPIEFRQPEPSWTEVPSFAGRAAKRREAIRGLVTGFTAVVAVLLLLLATPWSPYYQHFSDSSNQDVTMELRRPDPAAGRTVARELGPFRFSPVARSVRRENSSVIRPVRASNVRTVRSSNMRPVRISNTPVSNAQTPAATNSRPEWEYFVSEHVWPLERATIDTAGGRFEQQTQVRTTNVSLIEPEHGTQLEVSMPELLIEIVPSEE